MLCQNIFRCATTWVYWLTEVKARRWFGLVTADMPSCCTNRRGPNWASVIRAVAREVDVPGDGAHRHVGRIRCPAQIKPEEKLLQARRRPSLVDSMPGPYGRNRFCLPSVH
jgi:hypothetical protein